VSVLEKRVEALENASDGGGGGCERCRGLLTIVRRITGEIHSATWNGGEASEEEVLERQEERRCPRCGRELDPDETPVIRVGGGPAL
jgi:hypothetical protein